MKVHYPHQLLISTSPSFLCKLWAYIFWLNFMFKFMQILEKNQQHECFAMRKWRVKFKKKLYYIILLYGLYELKKNLIKMIVGLWQAQQLLWKVKWPCKLLKKFSKSNTNNSKKAIIVLEREEKKIMVKSSVVARNRKYHKSDSKITIFIQHH